MTVEIAMAERDAEDALSQQRQQRVIDIAQIAFSAQFFAELFQQTGSLFRFAQQCTAIRGNGATVTSRFDDRATRALQPHSVRSTLQDR